MKNLTFLKQKSFFKTMLLAVILMAGSGSVWGQPWSYNFGAGTGTFTSGTASITFLPTPTSGTARVRCGAASPSISMENPGLTALGTETELKITSGTGSASTTKFSIYDYTAGKEGYVKFKIAFSGGTNGVYKFSLGDGTNFSDNNSIATAQIFAGIEWTLGASNTISYKVLNASTYGTTGISNPTSLFVQNTSTVYQAEIYANNTTSTKNYLRSGTSYSLANATWDLWVDGTRVGTGLAKGAIGADMNIDSYAFNHQTSVATPGTIYLDDFEYSNVLPVSSTPTVVTPTFNPAGGSYHTSQSVSISTTTPSSSIYYTTDGTDPNNSGNGTLYTTAIPVSSTTIVKARAYATGFDPSAIASATYTILAPQTTTLPYTENFTTGVGKTYAHSVSGDAKVWTYNAGGFMNMNGYGVAAVEEDWLVLPGINLNNYTGTKTLSFDTWWQYGINDADNYLKLMYSTDYTGVGDPSSATWTELTYTQPTATNTWTSSGNIDLSSISGTSVYLAFKYRGTTGNYRSWSVDNISIQNPKYAVTFNVDMNGTSGYTDVYVAGSFNSWSPSANKMTTSGGNIYTFTTDAVFNSGDIIEFKIVKDGSTWESIANRTYTAIAGTNTVNVYWEATALPQLNWANLQYPATATIVSGNSLDVYAQVYEPGLTEAAGQGADISTWVGYSTTDTNPNTWTNWVLATFDKQSGNNDEYIAPIGSALAGGKYYYASRFKYGLNDYVYGGLNGLWDATSSKSGVLTVIATEPAAHVTNPAAAPNSSTEITLSWTDATANGYLIKGSAVSFDDIAAPVDGVAETNGTLVSNVTSGTQTYKFTGLSAETTYYFKIFPYNGSGEQINYKVDGSVPQASAKTYKAPTVLQAGDIAILQVNSATTDRIAFVTFVDLNPGTVINFTDNGFTSATNVRTGEGFLIYTAPAFVPAGTVISWYDGMEIVGTGWSAKMSNFVLTDGDQLFAYQGTWGSSQTLIYGVNLNLWITSGGGSTTTSYLPSALTDNLTAFSFTTNKYNAYYSNITSGTANALKSLITYNTNWTTSSTDQGAQSWTFALGTSTSLNANSSVFNLTVATGEIFTLEAAKQLTINGSLINNGTFTLQSGATVITNGVVSGSGINKVNQDLTYRTWYMSSPVASATPAGMLRIKSYNETTNLWAIDNSTMVIGKGYSITPIDGTNNILFTGGALNTGEKTITLDKKGSTSQAGFNSVGNPYPSYIDWKAMVTKNSAVLETNTMWYRSKIEGSFKFYTVDAGGVVVPANTAITAFIPPMQGFWVKTNTDASTLYFEDNMRSHAGTVANPSPNPLKAPAAANSEISLLRLQVSNGTNTDEAVIYSSANATNGYDFYDSPKMMNNDATIPEIHTTLNSQPIVINVMNSLPLDTEIGLAFVPGNATSFSLKASEITNLPADVKVILKDYANSGAETDLTDGVTAYDFAPATFTGDRFSVIFRSAGSTTGVDTNIGKCISVYSTGNCIQVTVNSTLSETASVRVFNSVGQQVVNQRLTSHTTTVNGNFKSGVYVVKVSNGTATAATQKIVIK